MPPPKDPIKYELWLQRNRAAQTGKKVSDETRKKMSESQLGNKNSLGNVASEETRKKMSIVHLGNKNNLGNKASEETKKKMSESHKGKPKSEEWKRKIGEAHTGMHHLTNESKAKIAKARIELYSGENHPLFGITPSDETKTKIRETNIKTWAEHPQLRKTISTANLGKNNGSYIDGRWNNYPLYISIRGCTKMRGWRRDVYRRDDYTCQLSGVKGKALEPHHIKSLSDICRENNITTIEEAMACEKLWDISNGITLEKTLHRFLHAEHGKQIPVSIFLLQQSI